MKAHQDITSDRLQLDGAGSALGGVAGLAGLIGLGASGVLAFTDTDAFLRGYVTNFAFVVSLALGSLFFVILQHLTRAGWSVVVRRLAEDVSTIFPLLALLALPIVIPLLMGRDAAHHVYPWTDAEHVVHSEVLQNKAPYLNTQFFVIRFAIYFAAWIVISRFFYVNSVRQDATGDPALTSKMQARSAPAIVVYGLTLTFFSFDLLMSLEPEWFSTIFGVYYFSAGAVGFFALLAIMMVLLQRAGRVERTISVDHYHDVGKLVFAFVVFWAYIAFSQYMLIWYGNIPEETGWYIIRQQQPWLTVSLIMLFGHFIVPFLALISRFPKRRKNLLIIGAGWMLLMHWFDMFYLAMPHAGADGEAANLSAPDIIQCLTCLVGLGGVCTWAVVKRMNRAALVPYRDPRLSESLEFENI